MQKRTQQLEEETDTEQRPPECPESPPGRFGDNRTTVGYPLIARHDDPYQHRADDVEGQPQYGQHTCHLW